MVDLDRTQDIDLLRQVAKLQEAENDRLRQRVAALAAEIDNLKGSDGTGLAAQVALLEKELASARDSGSKGSERSSKGKSKSKKTPKKKSKTGRTPQPDLPVETTEHRLDTEGRVCADCGGGLEVWKGKHEESEEIDIVDVKYVLRRHRRLRYRCRCGACSELAPGPDKLVARGRYSVDFMISVALNRFRFHMPLSRQADQMKASGLRVTRQTLWDQIRELADVFEEPMERLHQYLIAQDLLLADESHWPLLGATGRPTKNYYTWALASDDAVLYRIMDSRSNAAATELLRDFSGTLMTDGYVVYTSQSRTLGFTQAHCWAHGRRKFLEAVDSAPEAAQGILDEIGKLFGIEQQIAERTLELADDRAAQLRAQVRDEQSRPIVEALGRQMTEVKTLPKTPLARAIKYYANRWPGMTRFLDDPRIPLTTNAAERALRSTVLGRKNSLGSRSERGIEVAEVFYSVIGSCLLAKVDPGSYLRRGVEDHLSGDAILLPHEYV